MAEPTGRTIREIAVPAYGPTALSTVGTGAVLPVLALTARDLGASVGAAALVVALLGVGQLAGDLPAGALAARVGERRALLLACGAEAVAMAAGAVASTAATLAAAVFLLGLAGSVFGLARQAFITEAVPVHLRARALSTLGGVHRIGLFVGPFLGAAVVAQWGTRAAYLVGVLASGLAFLVVLFAWDLTAAHERAQAAGPHPSVLQVLARHRRVLVTLGVGALFVSAARAARNVLVPLWADAIGLDATATSLVFGIAGAVDMLLFYPAGWVMDRYGRMLVAVPAMLVLGTGMALLPLTSSFLTLTVVAMILGLGNGMSSGIVMTLGSDASPAVGRAQFLGGFRLLSDGGWAMGPALVSGIAAIASLGIAALALGGVAFLGAAWLRLWVPRYDPISRRTVQRRRGGG